MPILLRKPRNFAWNVGTSRHLFRSVASLLNSVCSAAGAAKQPQLMAVLAANIRATMHPKLVDRKEA
ncbi:MAG: hypothetical protein WCG85_06200 [Polyangia bacterium]